MCLGVCVCVFAVTEISGGTVSVSQMFTLLMCSFSSMCMEPTEGLRGLISNVQTCTKRTSLLRHPALKGCSLHFRNPDFDLTSTVQHEKNTLPELMERRQLLKIDAVEYFVLMGPNRAGAYLCIQLLHNLGWHWGHFHPYWLDLIQGNWTSIIPFRRRGVTPPPKGFFISKRISLLTRTSVSAKSSRPAEATWVEVWVFESSGWGSNHGTLSDTHLLFLAQTSV